jgi:adenosylhomocysteine nucleosidase
MIAIICAMDEEIKLLRGKMVLPVEQSIAAFTFIEGKLAGKDTVILKCGIGKVNAAVGAALLINKYRPSVVINSGSAGGIDKGLNIGDTVIASGLVQHDVDVSAFGYAIGQIPAMPAVFLVDETLQKLAEDSVAELQAEKILPVEMKALRGLITSGDAFFHKDEQIARLKRDFPGAKAVEMEGAAIAQSAFLFKTPCLVIRSLSDIAGKESPVKSEEFLPVASRHSAEIVLRLAEKL